MTCLVTTTMVEIAGEAMSYFPSLVAIGSLLVAIVAWDLASDFEGLKFKLLKKHLSLSTIPLLFIFILIILMSPG